MSDEGPRHGRAEGELSGARQKERRTDAGPGSVLALETSCDDTCAAVLDARGAVRSNTISSQGVHDRFGGVVPEIASRHHLELVNLVVEQALSEAGATLEEIELVAATQGPGLVGALLVGLSTAKALAAARELPFVPVDHLQGHVAANFIASGRADGGTGRERAGAGAGSEAGSEGFALPFVCLIASGGHTLLTHVSEPDSYRVLGRTLDDAAGEAFDKGARMLGLGYPGGAALERLAAGGDPHAFVFPGSRADRARGGKGTGRQTFEQGLDFSFAGLKTALRYRLRDMSTAEIGARAADLAASYQAAILDSLLVRAERGLDETGLDRLAVGGGVAANDELRRRLGALGASVHVPARELCTDNAAMIASAARYAERLEYPSYLHLDAYATGERPR
jgi:tRNA N6-adenosine threonylcarbamoyltransferase